MRPQYLSLSRTKFTKLASSKVAQTPPRGAFDIYIFDCILLSSGDWAPKFAIFPRVPFTGSIPVSQKQETRTVLRLVRNPKKDAHDYALHVLNTCLARAPDEPVALYACTMAFHELLNLIEEGFHQAWDSFHLGKLMARTALGENALPQSVYERAVRLDIINRPAPKQRQRRGDGVYAVF